MRIVVAGGSPASWSHLWCCLGALSGASPALPSSVPGPLGSPAKDRRRDRALASYSRIGAAIPLRTGAWWLARNNCLGIGGWVTRTLAGRIDVGSTSSRRIRSSSADGRPVVAMSPSGSRTSKPVFSCTISTLAPGCRLLSRIALDSGSKSMTHRLVNAELRTSGQAEFGAVGATVTPPDSGSKVELLDEGARVVGSCSRCIYEASSSTGPPCLPPPGRRTFGWSNGPMTVLLTLP